MRKRVITFFALASLIIPLNIASASDRARVDPTKAIQAAVNKCITPEQMDCLSSVSLVIAGSKVLANQVSIDSDTETDSSGQITESGKSTWSYTSGGVSTNFTIDATLITPVYVVSGSNDEVDITEIDENADSEEDSETEASPKTEKVSLDTRYFEPKLDISISGTPANASVEVIVRTSWLQVQDAYLTARDSSVKLSAIKDGNEITLVGSQVNLYQQQKQKNQITGLIKTIITPIPTINFTLFHPKQADSSAACTKYGFRTTSTNGSSLSIADENAINSLLFNASGSTTKEDGTKNLGSALISIPLEWARCFYPNSNFGFGETFGVRVTSNLGAAKAQNVKSSAAIKGGILEVSVEGFEFAKTTILIETDAAKAAQRRADLANATAKAEADAKAKAQAEADARAKAEAEAKAKAEADAKAAAEKAAAEKAAADLKAQQEAEAKAKAEAAAKSGSTKKITTITCVKGKLSKKVKGINPKCPSGFKKR